MSRRGWWEWSAFGFFFVRRSVPPVHAQVFFIPKHGELVALHTFRPFKAILAHDGLTFGLDAPTNRSADGKSFLMIAFHADGSIQAAQERHEILVTLHLGQGPKLVSFHAGLLLSLVVELIYNSKQNYSKLENCTAATMINQATLVSSKNFTTNAPRSHYNIVQSYRNRIRVSPVVVEEIVWDFVRHIVGKLVNVPTLSTFFYRV